MDGSSDSLNYPAPGFTLTDQAGQQVSLASLRGKVVLLTFLDPVCTSDCPLIAQEFREADQMLGARPAGRAGRGRRQPALPVHRLHQGLRPPGTADRAAQLAVPDRVAAQLRHVWSDYGVAAEILPAGGMIAHNDVAYVIDAAWPHQDRAGL